MSNTKETPSPRDKARHSPCMGCSRAELARWAGFDWPCGGHDEGSTMAELEDSVKP